MTPGDASTLRQRQASLTRHTILDAAAATVAERGLHDFSVQEIADRAGVSHRTVYRHFTGREELLEALAERLDDLFARRELPVLPERADDVAEGIRAAFDLFDEHRELVRAVALGALASGAQPRSRQARDRAVRDVAEAVGRGLPENELRRASAVVRYLANSLAWVVLTEQLGLDREDATRAVTWAVETLLDDVRGRAETTPPAAPGEDE